MYEPDNKTRNNKESKPYVGVFLVDQQNKIRFLNSGAEKITGINKKDSIGRQLMSVIYPESSARTIEQKILNLHTPGETACSVVELHCAEKSGLSFFRATIIYLEDSKQLILEAVEWVSAGMRNAGIEQIVQARMEELSKQNKELIMVNQSLETVSEEINAELEMAKKIQESILPAFLPEVNGYEFSVEYSPSGKVGGDFYDVRMLDKDNLLLLEADVSGHGVAAAFVTTIAKSFFDRYIKADVGLAKAISAVNMDICENIKTEHYITAFIAVLHLPTATMNYCRICHPYPILYRSKSENIEILKNSGGFFLGMKSEENKFSVQSLVLEPNDRLLIYTDGLNEGFNAKNSQYGRERLAKSVEKYGRFPAKDFLAKIMEDREMFMNGQQEKDDITVLSACKL